MENYNESSFVNVGTGIEHSIFQVAEIIKEKVEFEGDIIFNTTYPNGTPRKFMDVNRVNNLGWKHKISFEKGIEMVLENIESELEKYN